DGIARRRHSGIRAAGRTASDNDCSERLRPDLAVRRDAMKLRFALVVLFPASLILTAQAQDVPEIPSALFDIELGGIYEYRSDGADENSPGTFPVRRLVSEQLSVHRGISLYFEP